MWLWSNGQIVRDTDASVPLYDHGFLYGMGLFETFRTYGRTPFLFDWHWDRLERGLAELWIDIPYTKEELLAAIEALHDLNEVEDLYVRLNVSAGVAPLGLHGERYGKPNVSLIVKPLPSGLAFTEKTLEPLPFARSTPEASFRLKSHHYMNNILGKRALVNADAEGLFANDQGHVVEGLVSNIFAVKDGIVYTPPESDGPLLGVTRRWVMNVCDVHERSMTFEDLRGMDELWLTNSIQQIAPVRSFEGVQYPGSNGRVFQDVWARLKDEVGEVQR